MSCEIVTHHRHAIVRNRPAGGSQLDVRGLDKAGACGRASPSTSGAVTEVPPHTQPTNLDLLLNEHKPCRSNDYSEPIRALVIVGPSGSNKSGITGLFNEVLGHLERMSNSRDEIEDDQV